MPVKRMRLLCLVAVLLVAGYSARAADGLPVDDAGFIRNWLVLGPVGVTYDLHRQDASTVGVFFDNEQFTGQYTATPNDGDTVTVRGNAMTFWRLNATAAVFDFPPQGQAMNIIVTYVVAEQEIANVKLGIGSNDSSCWRLNSQEVIRHYAAAFAAPDQAKSQSLTLRSGVNVLMGTVINGTGTAGACARFLDSENNPVKNITISLQASGGGTPPPPTNLPPAANAGADVSVEDADRNGSQGVQLDGSASTDPDGSIASYLWREGSTTLSTDDNPVVSLSTGVHTITLVVTDDDGATATDTVVVTVLANLPPVADAGSDVSGRDDNLDGLATVSFDASDSHDQGTGGSIASYEWYLGDDLIATGATPSHTLPVGTHRITLTVTDNEGAPASDTLTVTILFQDDDGDGIADTWEIDNFEDTSSADATSDHDGDGSSDLREFSAGTDPMDPASFPPVSAGGLGVSCMPGAGGSAGTPMAALMLGAWLAMRARRTSKD
jgi:hypothetical protein